MKIIFNLIKEHWPKYVIEILVVMISIVIAFQVDLAWAAYKNKELKQTFLKNVQIELSANEAELQGLIAKYHRLRLYADSVTTGYAAFSTRKVAFIGNFLELVIERRSNISLTSLTTLRTSKYFERLGPATIERMFQYQQAIQEAQFLENRHHAFIEEMETILWTKGFYTNPEYWLYFKKLQSKELREQDISNDFLLEIEGIVPIKAIWYRSSYRLMELDRAYDAILEKGRYLREDLNSHL